jgi:hypothetical protein
MDVLTRIMNGPAGNGVNAEIKIPTQEESDPIRTAPKI